MLMAPVCSLLRFTRAGETYLENGAQGVPASGSASGFSCVSVFLAYGLTYCCNFLQEIHLNILSFYKCSLLISCSTPYDYSRSGTAVQVVQWPTQQRMSCRGMYQSTMKALEGSVCTHVRVEETALLLIARNAHSPCYYYFNSFVVCVCCSVMYASLHDPTSTHKYKVTN